MMRFRWIPYKAEYESLVESWFDEETCSLTGCDGGWADYYSYWNGEEGMKPGENFWAILAAEQEEPCAIFVIAETEGLFTFSECAVDPQMRGQGIGKAALSELLGNSPVILGRTIREAMAVIYPNNPASKKMFQYAGFRYVSAHPDGDVLYFFYTVSQLCYCGHDCGRCVTRLADRLGLDFLRENVVSFYEEQCGKKYRIEEIHCSGGRTGVIFTGCQDCPFIRCCRKNGLDSCLQCPAPCELYIQYRKAYVNSCHQI